MTIRLRVFKETMTQITLFKSQDNTCHTANTVYCILPNCIFPWYCSDNECAFVPVCVRAGANGHVLRNLHRHIPLSILNTCFNNILEGFSTITKTHFETCLHILSIRRVIRKDMGHN
jgi:hypothetical protein